MKKIQATLCLLGAIALAINYFSGSFVWIIIAFSMAVGCEASVFWELFK